MYSRPSPNYGERPPGTVVDTIVLHADAAVTVAQSLAWMLERRSKVSYHLLIGRLGDIYELVPSDKRAWHAGVSEFLGRPNCNDYSVGVSFGNKNDGQEPYRVDQLRAGARVCAALIRKHPAITLERITTHALVALPPGRKTDPGPMFDLAAFRASVDQLL